jgi:large subunit ribosomal protein L15
MKMKSKTPYKKKKKRIGRGPSSGHGKTSCRGEKGQLSRSGSRRKPGFEGGQNPLIRRIPKRGFNHASKKRYQIINLEIIEKLKDNDITAALLLERGVIRDIYDGLKILGDGTLKRAVTVHAQHFSKQAKEKIEKAGGKALEVAA